MTVDDEWLHGSLPVSSLSKPFPHNRPPVKLSVTVSTRWKAGPLGMRQAGHWSTRE
jgi:hypothetical protein